MRLIDADKLKSLFSPALQGRTEYSAEEIHMAIVTFPTIKAIPIEWFKNYIKKHTHIIKNYETTDENDLRAAERIVIASADRMLEDWEKENEID